MPFTFCCHFPVLFFFFLFGVPFFIPVKHPWVGTVQHLRQAVIVIYEAWKVQIMGSFFQCTLYHECVMNICECSCGRDKDCMWWNKVVRTNISKYLEMKSQEMFQGQLLKVHCYPWNCDLVLFLRDWFGNCDEKWKSLFSTEVSWTCTGFPVLFWFSRSLFPVPLLQKVHAIPIKYLR